jgi:hypothetical protein
MLECVWMGNMVPLCLWNCRGHGLLCSVALEYTATVSNGHKSLVKLRLN